VKVLVCGDRNWTDRKLISRELAALVPPEGIVMTVIHGAARGADTIGGEVAHLMGAGVRPFPADWAFYGRAAGPTRNQRMLDDGKPDLVLAFHDDLANSKGTADMVRRAEKAGVPVKIVSHPTLNRNVNP
jgi:hypothetical protein